MTPVLPQQPAPAAPAQQRRRRPRPQLRPQQQAAPAAPAAPAARRTAAPGTGPTAGSTGRARSTAQQQAAPAAPRSSAAGRAGESLRGTSRLHEGASARTPGSGRAGQTRCCTGTAGSPGTARDRGHAGHDQYQRRAGEIGNRDGLCAAGYQAGRRRDGCSEAEQSKGGRRIGDERAQKGSIAAPVPPADVKSTPKESVLDMAKAEELAAGNDIAACQKTAREMRVAGVAMPPPLMALAALDLQYHPKPGAAAPASATPAPQ